MPGITPSMLAGRLGIAMTTTLYHLRVLQRRGVVVVVARGRRLHCFRSSACPPSARPALAVLADPSARRLVLDLASEPDAPLRRRAQRLGVSHQAVSKQLHKLRRAGLVAQVPGPVGRPRWCPSQELLRHMGASGSTPDPPAPPALPPSHAALSWAAHGAAIT